MKWLRCSPFASHWTIYTRLFLAASAINLFFLLMIVDVPQQAVLRLVPALAGGGGGQPSSQVSCRRLFGLSQARMFWEKPSPDSPTACLGSGLQPRQATPCLTRLRRRLGRPAHVLFIGDSRARILFMKVRESLKLLWRRRILHDAYHSAKNASFVERGRRLPCPHSTPMFHGTAFLKWVCHLEVLGELARATFFWAPYLGAGYAERLAVVEEDCRRGLACPDLIVMTIGMWYAKLSIGQKLPRPDRPQLFADELRQLVPLLRNLSQHTQLVYRLDGSDFMEGYGNKSTVNGVVLAVNAVATETLREVPGLQLWSSSLAETVRFQHTVCLQLAAFHTPVLGKHGHECMDENHVAETVRLSAAAAVIRYLCRDTEQHPDGHCCHTRP